MTRMYMDFRTRCMASLSADIKAIATGHGKQFGANTLDAELPPELFFGVSLAQHAKHADYLLIENFNHPACGRTNRELFHALERHRKPVFIVSYKRVIGRHSRLTQSDIDAIHSESAVIGYQPCYKASEFTTRGRWHNLSPGSFRQPAMIAQVVTPKNSRTHAKPPFSSLLVRLIDIGDRTVLMAIYERRLFRKLFGWLLDSIIMRQLP